MELQPWQFIIEISTQDERIARQVKDDAYHPISNAIQRLGSFAIVVE
jgi:hypothetical protein